jgi:hypothetical protein
MRPKSFDHSCLVAVPVGRIGEGQPVERAGRIEGRQRRDLLAEVDLGRIERRRIVLPLGNRNRGFLAPA